MLSSGSSGSFFSVFGELKAWSAVRFPPGVPPGVLNGEFYNINK